jgi:F0F1-type ATP synthase assembly protein I
MGEADHDKARNREIAENEAQRQTVSAIRVSTWAIAVAVVIGLAAIGWVLLHNH